MRQHAFGEPTLLCELVSDSSPITSFRAIGKGSRVPFGIRVYVIDFLFHLRICEHRQDF